ncbi:MAG TPA: hypothetical protein VK610_01970 [Rhodothermales bacterium]|nr:hypothetical protein [Rhodothermales bacterium]
MSRENPDAAAEKRDAFIAKLKDLGYKVDQIKRKPVTYRINGKRVNVRVRDIPADTVATRFWYDLSTSVLDDVDYVAYLTTSLDYFVMMPSGFLKGVSERMSTRPKHPNKRVFYLDWDRLELELTGGERISFNSYYHNLKDEAEYPSL